MATVLKSAASLIIGCSFSQCSLLGLAYLGLASHSTIGRDRAIELIVTHA